MCYERVVQGQQTACAEVCPEDATVFGDRDELLRLGRRRIQDRPDDYSDYIYGESEVGGTSTLFITPVDSDKLGLKKMNITEPLPRLTWKVLEKIPSLVLVLGTALTGVWWITSRRAEVQRAESGKNGGDGNRSDERTPTEVPHE